MKNLSRLTALLLAVMLLFQTAAFATTGVSRSDLDRDTWDAWVQEATEAAEAQSNQNVTITEGGEVYVNEPVSAPVDTPIYESTESVALNMAAAGAEREISVTLPQYGKVQLTVGESGGQWQVQVGEQWINVAGENGSIFDVTFAKVQSLFQINGYAKVRYASADGAFVSDIAVIGLSYGSQTLEEDDLDSVSDEPVMMFAARSSADEGIATVAEGEGNTTFNVTINYIFENKDGIVADPYTANLAAGSDFSTRVNFPTIQGYQAYYNNAQATYLDLNYTNIQQGYEYTVVYKPADVNYTVIHYQQNVDNDNYTEVKRVTQTGKTDSYFSNPNTEALELAENYPGFYALLYNEQEVIAADGSTIVEIYYDRNYYLMQFNLDGGYGVEPIYARYGATISVGKPTKAGYTFDNWSPEVPATVPVNGGTYTAQWKMNNTAKVSVVLWGENPNDEKYSYLTTGELMLTPNTPYAYNGTDQLYLYCDQEAHTHTDACGLKCGKEEHTQHTENCLGCGHVCTLDCFKTGQYNYYKLVETTKPNQINTVNPVSGTVYTYTQNRWTHYYLYLGGKWYCAESGSYGGGGDTTSITSVCSHTHDATCYTCEYHEHTDACYSCGKEAHTHDSNCTGTVAGLNSNLWKFVKSDTVTVNPDGSSVINVYYDRTTFTMTFKEEGNNGDTLDTITDKWGADIKTRFETISKENTFFWSRKSNGGSPWTSFMDIMPQENRTYYADPRSGSTTITATYLAENLAGTGYETLYTVSFKGSSTISVTKEEFVSIEGFTFNDAKSSDVGDRYNGSEFYYDRHHYAIEFYNPTTLLKKTEDIPYQSPLSSYNWTPDASQAPAKYEPGSVSFEGWYLNPECTGEKFDFATSTMPAGTNDGDTTLTLYAKWVPVTHKVEFYLDEDRMVEGTQLDKYDPITVPHGTKVPDPIPEPDNGDYEFVGWFYKENGVEKAFDFANMPINRNMKVYAKWSSNTLLDYVVYFKLYGSSGILADATDVAAPIEGSALAGSTKTFEAKGNEYLYADYQEGYFPQVQSHSLTLSLEDLANNHYVFWYVKKDAVPYKVHYVTEEQPEDTSLGTIELNGKTYYKVAASITDDQNKKAVVTETFEVVSGYMPDAYQKRLVLTVDENGNPLYDQNVIVFYYTKDEEHAYYQITHYTEDLNGGWKEYAASQAQGDIGETYSAKEMTIQGFTFDASVQGTLTSGKLTAEGLHLKLYYKRNMYPYQVNYLEKDSGKVLAPAKTKDENGNTLVGKYGTSVTENAIDIANYTAVNASGSTLIYIEDTPTLNIINIYYTENEVTINYVAVGPEGATNFGSVTPTSETVNVITGNAQGSEAAATSNAYKFVGWYDNVACTGTALSTDAEYVPTKANDAVWVDGITYYAKFEYNLTTLTITKSGMNQAVYASGDSESAIFTVVEAGTGKTWTVVLNAGNSFSVTLDGLTVGTNYTITELTDWTWRYTAGPNPIVHTLKAPGGDNTVEFSNTRTNPYWLGGDNYKVNVFGTK